MDHITKADLTKMMAHVKDGERVAIFVGKLECQIEAVDHSGKQPVRILCSSPALEAAVDSLNEAKKTIADASETITAAVDEVTKEAA